MCITPYALGTAMQPCWAGRLLGCSTAVVVVYTQPTPREIKQPRLGTINIQQQGPSYTTHTCLWQSRTTHPQTNLHTSGTVAHWVTPVWGLSADCGFSYQPLCSQSRQRKERRRGLSDTTACVLWHITAVCIVWHTQLSLLIWNNGAGPRLTEADFLCGYQHNDAVNSTCSVWLSANFPQCVSSRPLDFQQ